MQLNKRRWNVRLIFLVCGLTFRLSVVIAQQSQTQTIEEIANDKDTHSNHHHISDILNLIVDPIRATLSRARHLFSSQIDSLNDGTDSIRLRAFKMFMRVYNKTHSAAEIPRRMALFFRRRLEIANSIKGFRQGKSSFALRVNRFTDFDDTELKQLTGVSVPTNLEDEELSPMTVIREQIDEENMDVKQVKEEVPISKDWRSSGCISEPIDQKGCGACYAIATMAAVESMRCLKHVSSPILSPQQVVDCSTEKTGYDNHGCNGGWPTQVLKYLKDVELVARESCYPFKRRKSACKLDEIMETSGCTVRASVTDQRKLQYRVLRTEQDMLYHVAKTGPVIAVINAPSSFFYYGEGVFDDPICTKRRFDVDHAILIVGYGSKDGEDYWLLKNSWGTDEWGQGGYGLYKRGTHACSIGHWAWAIIA